MDKRTIHLVDAVRRQRAIDVVRDAPAGYIVSIRPPTRSLEQNSKLWPMLHDISEQVEWYGRHLTPYEWKDVFTASLRKLAVVPNLDGTGFVALGHSTSRMSKHEFSELLELISAFGAERGVEWSEQEAHA